MDDEELRLMATHDGDCEQVLRGINEEAVNHLLYTKSFDWRYEQEVRVFTRLDDRDSVSGHYFADFGDDLLLREVIVSPLSTVTKRDIQEAVGDDHGQVTFTKARLAFNSFNVVETGQVFPNSRSV